jgi:hypothetical protein
MACSLICATSVPTHYLSFFVDGANNSALVPKDHIGVVRRRRKGGRNEWLCLPKTASPEQSLAFGMRERYMSPGFTISVTRADRGSSHIQHPRNARAYWSASPNPEPVRFASSCNDDLIGERLVINRSGGSGDGIRIHNASFANWLDRSRSNGRMGAGWLLGHFRKLSVFGSVRARRGGG